MALAACVAPVHAPAPAQRSVPDSGEPEQAPAPEPAPEPESTPAIPSTALAVRPLHEGRVLISVAAQPEWAAMPITSVEQVDYHHTWKLEVGVKLDALPPELHEPLGGPIDLYGPDGKLCTVTLDRLALEVHVLPDDDTAAFDSERLWRLIDRPGEDDEVTVLLVGGFARDRQCDGALWARDARLPPPVVLRRAERDEFAELLAEERARVLDSAHGRELAQDYREHLAEDPSSPPWSSYAEGTGQVWIDERGEPRLIAVGFGEGLSKPCFPAPSYVAVRPIDEPGPWPYPLRGQPTPSAVFDADLDGRYEMLFVSPWGGLVLLDVIGETLRMELSLPDKSWINC